MVDADLVYQLQHNSKEAFEKIFLTYYSPLCEYASQFIVDKEAEELVSDLMMYIWESRKHLMIHTSLKSYLFMAVKFRCLNAIKKNKYHEQVHSRIYDKLKDQFENVDYYFVNELSATIEKAIEELPEKYKSTFQMSRFGEKTNAQIAEELDVSIKTVEYRISKALKILRHKLKGHILLLSLIANGLFD